MMFTGETSARMRFYANEAMSEFMNRDWKLPPRPWREMVDRFTLPKAQLKAIGNRMYVNFNYYQTNYVILLAITLVVFLLRHRWSLFIAGVLTAGWVYAMSKKPIVLAGRRITRRERVLTMIALSVLVPTASGILPALLRYAGLTFSVLVVHSILRHTNIRHVASDIRQQVNDKW